MPLFDLKNARRKLSAPSLSSLGLRKTQSTGNIDDSICDIVAIKKPTIITSNDTTPQTVSILRRSPTYNTTSDRPPTPPISHQPTTTSSLFPVLEDDDNNELLASKLRDITACDMELLLSLETQARMDCQEEKEKKQQEQQVILNKNRPSKIKFDLPITPPRSRSPDSTNIFHAAAAKNNKQRRSSLPPAEESKRKQQGCRLSRWSKLIKQQQQEEAENNKKYHNSSDISSNNSGSSDEDLFFDTNVVVPPEQQHDDLFIGSQVKLFKRPLPIIGTVKYIGQVHFDTGEWLGIELDSRGMALKYV
jgi:hypothetical protein